MSKLGIEMLQVIANGLEELKEEFQQFLHVKNLVEGIVSALPYGSEEEATEIILAILTSISWMRSNARVKID
jgi:hypothetical protein